MLNFVYVNSNEYFCYIDYFSLFAVHEIGLDGGERSLGFLWSPGWSLESGVATTLRLRLRFVEVDLRDASPASTPASSSRE